MRNLFSLVLIFSFIHFSATGQEDSVLAAPPASVLVIPYQPGMHLSDSDPDIAMGSEMDLQQMRSAMRTGLINELNKDFAEVYDVRGADDDFVREAGRDMDILYHSLMFESDSVYPLKDPKRFAIKDTSTVKKKNSSKVKPETSYINIDIHDQTLLPDFSEKYNADYFLFINELDIKTHFDDCMDLALKIYRRDLKVHYSIFDKHGKQIYGDVAVVHFASNSNDVHEIISKNFPSLARYILDSMKRATG
jgi:hypothetical protein